nr:putative F-box protein At3g52320 [Ipomoea batatas]
MIHQPQELKPSKHRGNSYKASPSAKLLTSQSPSAKLPICKASHCCQYTGGLEPSMGLLSSVAHSNFLLLPSKSAFGWGVSAAVIYYQSVITATLCLEEISGENMPSKSALGWGVSAAVIYYQSVITATVVLGGDFWRKYARFEIRSPHSEATYNCSTVEISRRSKEFKKMDCASKKLKKMDDATSIASLPQEIILKILPTLPPKSAVSFRCTSKFFHSFIPQPHFAFRILFWVSSTNLYTVDYTTEETHGKLQPTSLQCSADELRRFELLFGSSFADGKLCMFNNRNGETTILDLSTRQHISLPRTSFHPNPGQKLQVAPDLENAAAIALPAVLHRVRLAAEGFQAAVPMA